jgi:hypothetical protein
MCVARLFIYLASTRAGSDAELQQQQRLLLLPLLAAAFGRMFFSSLADADTIG